MPAQWVAQIPFADRPAQVTHRRARVRGVQEVYGVEAAAPVDVEATDGK